MLLIRVNKEQIEKIPERPLKHVSDWNHYFYNYLYSLNLIVENGIRNYEFNPRARAMLFLFFHITELYLKTQLAKNTIDIPLIHKLDDLSKECVKNNIHLPDEYFDIENKLKEIDANLEGSPFRYFTDKYDNPYFKEIAKPFDFWVVLEKFKALHELENDFDTNSIFDIDFGNKHYKWNLTLHLNECHNIHHVKSNYDYTAEFIIRLLIEEKVYSEKVYLPLFFLIRHSMELGLKANIIKIRELSPDLINDKKIADEHSLMRLFNVFNSFLQNIDKQKIHDTTKEQLNKFELKYRQLNNLIHDFDSNSYFFRFPENKNGIRNQFAFKENTLKEVLELYYFTDPFITFTVDVLQEEGLLQYYE